MCLVNVCTWQTNVRDIHGGGTYMVDRRVDVRGGPTCGVVWTYVVMWWTDVWTYVVTWWTDVRGGLTCGVDRRVDVRGDVVDRRTWWTDVWTYVVTWWTDVRD